MNEECTHDCSSCGQDCSERKSESLLAEMNQHSHVKNVVAVVSGKGGVGKSLVTCLLASLAQKSGKSAAVLDADITGPSVPTLFGIHERAAGCEDGIIPLTSKGGVKIMSLNSVIDDPTEPVIWRGPMLSGVVKQFWTDVVWGDIDWMFVDMPPGTADVPLTVFQSLPLSGIVIVTSPQELVELIATKAAQMAKMMNIPILALVENYSYFKCPSCGKDHEIFGASRAREVAQKLSIKSVIRIPILSDIAKNADAGRIEDIDSGEWFGSFDSLLKV